MSTFLHYVHCKDALLDCSSPGGERCESLTWVDEITSPVLTKVLRRGLLKFCSWIILFQEISIYQNSRLDTLNHNHIWQVSPQLSCGDTCQIWVWYFIDNVCFESAENLGKKKTNGGNWLSKSHPWCHHWCVWIRKIQWELCIFRALLGLTGRSISVYHIWALVLVCVRHHSLVSSSHKLFPTSMMTSSNGNIFRVTGPLCGEFTGHWWIPLTKPSMWYQSVFPRANTAPSYIHYSYISFKQAHLFKSQSIFKRMRYILTSVNSVSLSSVHVPPFLQGWFSQLSFTWKNINTSSSTELAWSEIRSN